MKILLRFDEEELLKILSDHIEKVGYKTVGDDGFFIDFDNMHCNTADFDDGSCVEIEVEKPAAVAEGPYRTFSAGE